MNWQELSPQIRQIVDASIRFIKARRREEASLGLAAILFYIGYNIIKWLPDELKGFVESFRGNRIIPGVFYVAGLGFLIYGIYRIYKLVYTPDLPPPVDRPSAIKGPLAFTPADGELFRKLGREDEIRKLLGYVEDNQIRLIVLMGASGAGKTSLLRAGLTDIIKGKNIKLHYWEVVPTDSGQALLRAIKESWTAETGGKETAPHPAPESLEDLINPSLHDLGNSRHIIVLDQFEQLRGNAGGQIFKLLQKVARKAKPPYAITWIISFRREFRADWSDFMIPEHEKGFYPPEISLKQFTAGQAKDVVSQLIAAADLQVENKIVDNLIEAATIEGEVSSVDIGIGLLILSELSNRQGGKTVTEEDYHFAGGAEGLLTQYVSRCLDNFPDEDRETIMNAMLALRDAETNQRIAEGKTAAELAAELETAERRLKIHLERLTHRDMRLLEHVESSGDDEETRYRLPHERIIPALNRLAGRLIGELEETKQKFAGAFAAWSKNKASQYLLKGKDLRLVELYKSQIPWGKDETEKLIFLKNSRRQRTLKRLLTVLVIISLTATGWLANSQYQRYDAQSYLRDNNYPPELYDYQNQLTVLKLNGEFNTKRFPWLKSNNLEEFAVKVTTSTNSLDGLADGLNRCPALKKLSLDISNSQVSDVSFLKEMKNLNQLSLITDREVSDISFLKEMTNLNQLSLNLNESNVVDINFLTEMKNLKQLSLDVTNGEITGISFLKEMTNLNRVSLDINNSNVGDISFLKEMKNLNQLSLNIRGHEPRDISFLKEMKNLNQLSLEITTTKESDISFLKEMENLNQLSLNISGNEVKDISFLKEMPHLNQLSLDISATKESNISFLKEMKNLNQLSLNVSTSNVSDISFLKEMKNLNQLSLEISNSTESKESLLGWIIQVRDSFIDISFLKEMTHLNRLSLNLNLSKISDISFLKEMSHLNQLSLDISSSEVSDISFLKEMTHLNQLFLDIRGSKVSKLDLQLGSNIQKLDLTNLTTEQRISIKTIPKSMTHLNF